MPKRSLVTVLAPLVLVPILSVGSGCSDSAAKRTEAAAQTEAAAGAPAPFVDAADAKAASEATRREFQAAPDFELVNVAEGKLKLSDLHGKIVLLDFWATWCGPCRVGIPHLNDLVAEHREDGFEVVGISVDRGGRGLSGIETVRAFLKKTRMDYPIVMADAQTVQAYGGIRSIPTAFLIDRDGRLRKRYVGLTSKAVFERDIAELLSESAESEDSEGSI